MKALIEKYPKGSFKYQKTDGRYIDSFLYQNLTMMAKKIVEDMTFLAVCFSSTLEVGTGKSVFCTQVGEIWSEIMEKVHGIKVPFDMNNVVFRPEELIERSFKVPKYSFLLLDEWEDSHYWGKLGMTLRKFFRKCRQLNLFIMIIIPNYFQLPLGYAISRSVFAVDVKFDENFNRGNYDFYNFKAKKELFMKGKKFHNYNVVGATFSGSFFDGYGVDEKQYRYVKRQDMLKYDDEDKKTQINPTDITAECFVKTYKNSKESVKTVASWFGVSERTGFEYLKRKKEGVAVPVTTEPEGMITYNKIHSKSENVLEGEQSTSTIIT
jgi:hypothetical protein